MLQLWYEECVPTGIHSGEVGYCGGVTLPPAMRSDAFIEGYELGHFEMAASN